MLEMELVYQIRPTPILQTTQNYNSLVEKMLQGAAMSSPGLYRGKPVAGGEMVKGCLLEYTFLGEHMCYITDASVEDYVPLAKRHVAVIPSTVGQATGLKMNEVEIWEGDKFQGKDTGNIYWVVFRDGEYILVYDCKSPPAKAYKFRALHYAIYNSAIEPIGTIHDKEPDNV